MSGEGLTDKQRRFAEEYLVDSNATQAAIRAGYSAKTAEQQGSRLLSNVKVRAHVNGLQAKVSERVELTVAGVTTKLLGLSEKAEGLEGSSALNVARQCLMDAAKLNGLVIETSETITRSPEERAARLATLKAERERLLTRH